MALRNIRFQKFENSAVGPIRAPLNRGRPSRMIHGPRMVAAPLVPVAISSNTSDPATANCRVFIGNINTFQLTHEDVQQIFQKYGQIAAVSTHKGYAFVQYFRTLDARNAAQSEDGMIYAGQKIDCNVASEPKQNSHLKKRASVAVNSSGSVKRAKIVDGNGMTTGRNLVAVTTSSTNSVSASAALNAVSKDHDISLEDIQSGSADGSNTKSLTAETDLLICGKCRSLFVSVEKLQRHKSQQCKLRFVCQCEPVETGLPYSVLSAPHTLTCAGCYEKFHDTWALIQHVQGEHAVPVCIEAGGLENPDAVGPQKDDLDPVQAEVQCEDGEGLNDDEEH